jgi:hypothetical protein
MTEHNFGDLALPEAKWRQTAAHVLERRLWRDWERALRELQALAVRLERGRSRWKARLAKAMRGLDSDVWWSTNRRIEAGELWVARGAQARRAQRVVYVTRPTVLALVVRRDADLHHLTAATAAADQKLREATRRILAAATWDRALTVLAVDPAILRSLTGPGPIPAYILSCLCRAPVLTMGAFVTSPSEQPNSRCPNLLVVRPRTRQVGPGRRQIPATGAGERGDTE